MTASPYHQGTNDKASDKALYKMEGELEVKPAHKIELEEPQLKFSSNPKVKLSLCQKLRKS